MTRAQLLSRNYKLSKPMHYGSALAFHVAPHFRSCSWSAVFYFSVHLVQKTIRVHLWHRARHRQHYLTESVCTRTTSKFSKQINNNRNFFPTNFNLAESLIERACTLSRSKVFLAIYKMGKKASTPLTVPKQLTPSYIHESYRHTTHAYTDCSMCANSVRVLYLFHTAEMFRMSQQTSTTTKLVTIREALLYIVSQQPQ